MAAKSIEPKQHQLQSEPVAMDFFASNGYPVPTASNQHAQSNLVKTAASGVKPAETKPAPVQSTATPNKPTVPSVPPVAVGPKQLTPLPAQPVDLSLCTEMKFVTLDGMLTDLGAAYEKISGTFQWEICGERDEHCVKYITEKCKKKRVFFIASGGLGAKVVPQIHDLPQVYAIYIYCENVDGHKKWADKLSKVRVVCNNDTLDLLPRLALDVARSNVDWGNALLAAKRPAEAKAKYEAALELLSGDARHPSSDMADEVNAGLEACGL